MQISFRHRLGERAMMPLGALLVALLLIGCDRPQAQNKSQQAAAPPPAVTTSQPVVSEIVEWDE